MPRKPSPEAARLARLRAVARAAERYRDACSPTEAWRQLDLRRRLEFQIHNERILFARLAELEEGDV